MGFKYTSNQFPVRPSTLSSMGRTWTLFPYFTSGQLWIATISPSLTLKLFLTTLFMRILSSVTVSSLRTMQTLSFLFFPFSSTVSPRNNCSSSILARESATTLLSSLTASSTSSLLGFSFFFPFLGDTFFTFFADFNFLLLFLAFFLRTLLAFFLRTRLAFLVIFATLMDLRSSFFLNRKAFIWLS